MAGHVSIAVFDECPGEQGAFDELSRTTRGTLLGRAVAAGGTLLAGGIAIGGLPGLAAAAPSPAQDAAILNVVLQLEELEAAFFTEAERRARLTPALRRFARVVGAHERAHVAFLRNALGSKARKRSTFDFGQATRERRAFAAAAVLLEDTVVAAYNGQAANLTKRTLAAAASIVSVEARHAGWIRAIVGLDPAPDPTDVPMSATEVARTVRKTGFVRR